MIVAQVFGATAMLWDGQRMVEATVAKRLKTRADRTSTLLAVGADVEVEHDERGTLSIVSVAPRRTRLARPTGRGDDMQIVAANAEQAGIGSSGAGPPVCPGPRGRRGPP